MSLMVEFFSISIVCSLLAWATERIPTIAFKGDADVKQGMRKQWKQLYWSDVVLMLSVAVYWFFVWCAVVKFITEFTCVGS